MTEAVIVWIIAAATVLAGLVVAAQAALAGWRLWLDLRRLEIMRRHDDSGSVAPAVRIELADLRERVRRLEAIAAGVEL